ncbi:MAG TPA: GAF domain-containing protein [Allocoleopsis sp.]
MTMTLHNSGAVPQSGGMLATLTQANNRKGNLTHRVKDLPVPQFIDLLEQITREFEHFLRAIDLINNETLETLLEQILEAFTLKIGQILQADRTTIFLVDEEKGQLWAKIAQSDDGKAPEIRIPIDKGIAGHVATTGECLNIPDAYSHPLFNKEVDKQTGYRTDNILCMPIFNKHERVVAVVQLLNKMGGMPFDSTDEQHFREFASSIGIILESCNTFYIAARNQKGVAALLEATKMLGRSLDLETTLRAVMDQARDLMQADRSTLFLLSQETNELWTKIADAANEKTFEIRIPANKGIAGYVASTGETLNIPNAYEDPRFDPSTDKKTGYYTRNILCMPVFNSGGDLIGVTQLINKHQGSFTNSDEEFMRAFNIQAGIALENAQLFENVLLEKQYQKDMLQSLSDAVISTDMQGKVVTINDAAIELLGCPVRKASGKANKLLWQDKLVGRYVWDIVPVENLQMRLQDSLKTAAKHYVPEQSLTVGLHIETSSATEPTLEDDGNAVYTLAISDRNDPSRYIAWNELPALPEAETSNGNCAPGPTCFTKDQIREIERSINLTVNPLTNPEGGVRGGLVVLEDISQEKRMKTTMYRYMTPGVAERVMALGEDGLMVGERKEVTILFSDIRGYTTLTENLEATKVVELLNQYFETMVEAIFNYEGTLDKFIGDAIMAVFGAPLPLNENHAWMAVQSALDMRRRLKEFNESRKIESQPQIHIGIGISSGEVVSGNIGSQKRMDYTVIGDGVNLSSRLESVTKEYGCDIVLSEFTYELCRDRIWVRELDKIRVKGKNKPVSIFELIGDRREPLPAHNEDFLEQYIAGRNAYMQMDFQQALHHFSQAQKLRETDQAVEVHLRRIQDYLLNPPPSDWDGVHTMTSK